jgi:midasin (ATPase involved in ribosome maturation)
MEDQEFLVSSDQLGANQQGPRKRQRVEEVNESVSEMDWNKFEQELRTFDIQHVQGKGKFAFAFVEGPLVQALRSGDWCVAISYVEPHFRL